MYALIYVESHFIPTAVSDAGAKGLTQVTPIAAKQVQQDHGMYPSTPNLFDPQVSLWYGTQYLEYCMSRTITVPEALACYNGGPAVAYRMRSGRSIPRETKNYVKKVIARWSLQRALEGDRLIL
jgi:soluble lytic murein transglycosylase-like protein